MGKPLPGFSDELTWGECLDHYMDPRTPEDDCPPTFEPSRKQLEAAVAAVWRCHDNFGWRAAAWFCEGIASTLEAADLDGSDYSMLASIALAHAYPEGQP